MINPTPTATNLLFDAIARTQGGMPHLLLYLQGKYLEHLQVRIDNLRNSGTYVPFTNGSDAWIKAPVNDFFAFATAFLTEHRVVENFFVDANHGIVLSNNDRMVICPGTDIAGTMQESGAVSITHGKAQGQ